MLQQGAKWLKRERGKEARYNKEDGKDQDDEVQVTRVSHFSRSRGNKKKKNKREGHEMTVSMRHHHQHLHDVGDVDYNDYDNDNDNDCHHLGQATNNVSFSLSTGWATSLRT